jgi:predicted nucleic acid-binding protein
VTTTLLLDNSAWVRLCGAALPAERADQIAEALESGSVAACLPFLLEAGYSARDAREHDQLVAELLSLPQYHFDDAAEKRALDAQAQLARAGRQPETPANEALSRSADPS